MANTVFTPDSLERSVQRGSFKVGRMADYLRLDGDEFFVFRFPSTNILNQDNGDGDLLEIWDAATDLTTVTTSVGDIAVTPDTPIYYR